MYYVDREISVTIIKIKLNYKLDIATAKAVKTLQRLKSPLVMQSPPTRTQVKSVLTILAIAISKEIKPFPLITNKYFTV